MKMKVRAVTPNWTREEAIEAFQRGPDAVMALKAERGRIVHLDCGHEFRIDIDAPEPSQFDCNYCSRVATIEETDDATV